MSGSDRSGTSYWHVRILYQPMFSVQMVLNCKLVWHEKCKLVCYSEWCSAAAQRMYQQTTCLQERSNRLSVFTEKDDYVQPRCLQFSYCADEYKSWLTGWITEGNYYLNLIFLSLFFIIPASQQGACLKEDSGNKENNNIYLLIHRLYISWYNSDILLLAKIL